MINIETFIKESLNIQKKYANLILLNPEEDKVLIVRRANYMKRFKGMWGFPGGSVNENDKDSKISAIRELEEETGIKLSWNESHNCKKYDSIKNDDGSISDYYLTTLESNIDVHLSREHSAYEWFNSESDQHKKWMPDIFKIIQKVLDKN